MTSIVKVLKETGGRFTAGMNMEEIKKGRWRHFKGNDYEVLHIARHSESLEPMVVYRALYGDGGVWVRPASMWAETVQYNGAEVQRFTFIDFNR